MNKPSLLSDTDTALLQRALALAANGRYGTTPNPRVGCVICKDGNIVGEGWHARAGAAHAEVAALAQAGAQAAGSEMYVSLEPCVHHGQTPPCCEALIAAGVKRVVAAMSDPNPQVGGGGFAALRAAGIEVAVADSGSDIALQARRLNLGFISRMLRRRPWLRLKIAATLDGKTALHSGLSRWITGEAARTDGHHLRACSCAILTGIGTALQDDPQLTVRHVQTERQPLRLLVDSQLRARRDMQLFADGHVLVAAASEPPADFPAEVLTLATADGRKVDLPALMGILAQRGINEILVEAGRQLNGALLAEGLADEIVLYLNGRVFGESGRDMFKLPPPESPQQAAAFIRSELSGFADGDIKVVYQCEESLRQCQVVPS